MEENINILDIAEIIKKRYKIIAITTVIGLIISLIISFFIITPKYETSVKLFIGKSETKINSGYDNNEVQMYQNLLSTYSDVITTNDLVQQALNQGGIDLTPQKVLKNLQVTPKANTQIMEIDYRDTNPGRAVSVINNITNSFIQRSKILIPNSNVQILEKASYPQKAVSPNKTLYVLLGIILGILVGLAIIFVQEALDNTYRSKENLEKDLDIPVIGMIIDYSEGDQKEKHSSRAITRGRRKK
ncbi:Wzz/FepE/Etk N-terminal domain-containing protein [uncultured Clostridium sp.]|uniref:YveK family protein n=1 Tax=uncultured Clostridium sp. TaxID=59620 RepID=UPI00261AB172|nr:Wzz/FepE/Etk N-terminal domain-containing protein [uncultured Clostridium sp.]